tara:strand:+ start:45 stop:1418 length:1374 start_codon:yes stop_codon:yes gene_type:complete
MATYVNRTPSSASNRKTWTFSTWLKRSSITTDSVIFAAGSGTVEFTAYFKTGGTMEVYQYTSGTYNLRYETSAMYKDPSAWYHVVIACDTTQANASDRFKIYVNGSQVTAFNTSTAPSQDLDTSVNLDVPHVLGKYHHSSGGYYLGYLSQSILTDGTAYAASTFGSTDSNGVWIPNTSPSVTYGTNGFKLDYPGTGTSAAVGNFGADSSGNNNHFTGNSVGTNANATDTPQNNFATWNDLGSNASSITEGALRMVGDTGTNYSLGACSSIAFQKGKWYAEFKVGTFDNNYIGLCKEDNMMALDGDYQYQLGQLFYKSNGNKASGDGSGNFGADTSYGASYTSGDIIGVAADMDNLKLYFSKNGTFQDSGNPASGSTGTGAAFTSSLIGGAAGSDIKADTFYSFFSAGYNDGICQANFGNPSFTISSSNADANGYGSFEYAVPSGYYALCTKNLAQYG